MLAFSGVVSCGAPAQDGPRPPRPSGHPFRCAEAGASQYDRYVLGLRPVIYLPLAPVAAGDGPAAVDLTACPDGAVGSLVGVPERPGDGVEMPNGDSAMRFDGHTSVELASSPRLSIPTTGWLTVQAWMRPDRLSFGEVEGSGYVNWLGKGAAGRYEYGLRMYSADNSQDRESRISGYAFNLDGGLGSGSYFQDPVLPRRWLLVTVVYAVQGSDEYPAGTVTIFRDGHRRMTTPLSQFDVTPRAGDAPLRIGTMNGRSHFEGAIAKVAVFDRPLAGRDVQREAEMMRLGSRSTTEPG